MEALNYREMGKGKPIIILHGLFGSSDNWLTIGKKMSENYHVFLIDQRNHGDSPHTDESNYQVMARDLEEFMDQHQLDSPILLGHSMGGKTIMQFAANHPDKFEKLLVIDIAPKQYPVHHEFILDAYKSIDLDKVEKRSDAEKMLAEHIDSKPIRQFLLKNLKRKENNRFEWKINLAVIDKNIEEIGKGLEEKFISDKPALFVRGERSNYIDDPDFDMIKTMFPNSNIVTIKEAGHWIHAEKPEAFLKTIMSFIDAY